MNNREIKFRGQRQDNGELCFGTYHYNEKRNHHYILVKECFLERGEEVSLFRKEVWEVIPETVCQYTGLKDKNGKEIYEGDVIRIRQPYRTTQTHTGNNIPGGSYTEPMEPGIKTKEETVIFNDGVFGIEDENYPNNITALVWIIIEYTIEEIRWFLSITVKVK